jgi:hypothetical protein
VQYIAPSERVQYIAWGCLPFLEFVWIFFNMKTVKKNGNRMHVQLTWLHHI